MYMYMCTSPSSPLAPSDVSSPLVVMATSSSITVTVGGGGGGGGPQLARWGSPDNDLQHAGTTDDTSDICDRFATSNHIFGLHIYTCVQRLLLVVKGWGHKPPLAHWSLVSKRYMVILISISPCPPSLQNYHTHLQLTYTHRVPIGVQSPVVVSEGTHFLHLVWLPPAQPNGVMILITSKWAVC